MGNLAVLLARAGHDVVGSDRGIYPPMDGILAAQGVRVLEGYDPSHLSPTPDLVVVGNVCRPDHPEAASAVRRGLPVASMPRTLASLLLRGRRPLVVAGTHGKTTTTALIAHLLAQTGHAPGYLLGGRIRSAASGAEPGSGRWFVLEGDEYDSAFFEKTAKFHAYRPRALVLTSMEHDHVDIYPTWGSYRRAFTRLVTAMPAAGRLVACADHPEVLAAAARAPCPVTTYTAEPGVEADWTACRLAPLDGGVAFELVTARGSLGRWTLPATGAHNVANAVAALAVCVEHAGMDADALRPALATFPGVARRQHEVGRPGGVRVVDDFGHHPTAVKLTLEGIRAGAPDGTAVVAVLRPASATACRALHQHSWPAALALADNVILAPPARTNVPRDERLDLARLRRDVEALGSRAELARSLDDVPRLAAARARPGDTIVLFSNSDTAGTMRSLLDALART
jgi:UDP-N-acetylmuramate: L-alanyl-gamma-D-glutamyl-meso-diaminopimelate ligase